MLRGGRSCNLLWLPAVPASSLCKSNLARLTEHLDHTFPACNSSNWQLFDRLYGRAGDERKEKFSYGRAQLALSGGKIPALACTKYLASSICLNFTCWCPFHVITNMFDRAQLLGNSRSEDWLGLPYRVYSAGV
jgi:hypothetical protein